MVGVFYKFKPQNKFNGTLFYCYEYYRFLKNFIPLKFYILGMSTHDRDNVNKLLSEKYKDYKDEFTIVERTTDLYKLKLQKTLILDVDTFYATKEFLTGHIHCFSNDSHEKYRYKDDRKVTYYGFYLYQNYDVENMLKLNFDIMKPSSNSEGVFVSGGDMKHISNNVNNYQKQFNKPVILKKHHSGNGNIFDMIDHVHYVHAVRDTNNRIIPEAFFHNKKITIEERVDIDDSTRLRYNDIKRNGLSNYTITKNDEMVKACLQ